LTLNEKIQVRSPCPAFPYFFLDEATVTRVICARAVAYEAGGATDEYFVGQWLDVFCNANLVYYEAKVVQIDGNRLKLHFKGWASKYDEWVLKVS
jgi:hypothetical protein